MRASTQTTELLTAYYAAMEANRRDLLAGYYAQDMTLTFGNAAPIQGREAVVEAFGDVLDRVRSLAHDLVRVWEEEDGVVVLESLGRWTTRAGTVLEIPAATAITVVDGVFTDQRIWVDNAPVFAALEREGA
ncbi:nuclear transport factor 2 family protein [Modestobacter sp. Leaf380]|uniref:nuclear transport factor 2 family protein n=1 Tax=Modestobacter sp. Leaf380 TaxID=1736356 RepID=UPI0006F1CA20|nr:nuclear transport factor 2 family protein [Modestobacter sp. Leaf380]KQS64268.1 hypothetical protein ASG41_16495 [Modestobacter sp. Leaf380]